MFFTVTAGSGAGSTAALAVAETTALAVAETAGCAGALTVALSGAAASCVVDGAALEAALCGAAFSPPQAATKAAETTKNESLNNEDSSTARGGLQRMNDLTARNDGEGFAQTKRLRQSVFMRQVPQDQIRTGADSQLAVVL